MQVIVMLIFLAVWLIILWIGSIALEKTGMARSKARFQALSALTGTGFTTREAESIVSHPRRRGIATWLIFIGNAGIIAFIILMILYIRAGLRAPSVLHIGVILGIILIFMVLTRLKVLDKLTTGLIQLTSRNRAGSDLRTEERIYEAGDFSLWRFAIMRSTTSTASTSTPRLSSWPN